MDLIVSIIYVLSSVESDFYYYVLLVLVLNGNRSLSIALNNMRSSLRNLGIFYWFMALINNKSSSDS